MKRSEIFFDAILLPVDYMTLVVASIGAYAIRVSPAVRALRPVLFEVDLSLREYIGTVLIISLFTLAIFALLGLYSMEVTRRAIDEFSRILSGITVSAMGVILWMFLHADVFESRFILITAWVSSILCVTLVRYLVRTLQLGFLEHGVGAHRVVIVGTTPVADQIARDMKHIRRIGYEVVAHVPHASYEVLEQMYKTKGIDEILQCDPSLSDKENFLLLDFCEDYKIDYKFVPNLYSTLVSNVRTRTLAGFPMVELRRTPLDGWGRVVKRSVDLCGAVIGLLTLSPIFFVIALCILLDSPGPVFFRQIRVGRNKEPFPIVKFRTMVLDAEAKKEKLLANNERKGPLFKIRNDPRITRVGKWLRKTRLDEFPQLWNVLRNDMSLIGPRPHLPQEIALYRKEHRRLFTIKPGMTGLAQVSGSSDLPFEEEATLDIQYIEQWNLKLDMQIFLKTLWKVLWDRSAV